MRDYVDWDYMRQHEERTREGFDRLSTLEEEVMGNQTTGRKSLREEMIGEVKDSMKQIHAMVFKTSLSILGAILAKFIYDILTKHP